MTEPDTGGGQRRSIARGHYLRMMRWMALAAALAVGGALLYLYLTGGPLRLHMVIATIAGVGLSVLLGAGLMLLVFMSAGSGHDEQVARRHEEKDDRK